MLYELRYEGWASQYQAGRSFAVFFRLWGDGRARHELVATLGRDDATAIGAKVGEPELRSAVVREAVRLASEMVWTENMSVQLSRSSVEAMVHSATALPALRPEVVIASFSR